MNEVVDDPKIVMRECLCQPINMKFPDDGKYELTNQSDSILPEGYVSIVIVHT